MCGSYAREGMMRTDKYCNVVNLWTFGVLTTTGR
jgi:hypothetical protein